ncbi:unnamed protein product [Mytilus edulis]|uniref:Uncharacterized protein n=1 Tax=Mytilus edulis TaxID=6550 RepID=A0A8S3UXZ3_MYTED|nr:unnamed protein product [Mytilus edulis]
MTNCTCFDVYNVSSKLINPYKDKQTYNRENNKILINTQFCQAGITSVNLQIMFYHIYGVWITGYIYESVDYRISLRECGLEDISTRVWIRGYLYESVDYRISLRECGLQDISTRVWITGYLYKRYLYESVDYRMYLRECGLEDISTSVDERIYLRECGLEDISTRVWMREYIYESVD